MNPAEDSSQMTDTRPALGLNWDALRAIAFCADRSSCATLMLSCRFLYHEAAKAMLSHPISLTNEEQASKLLQFLRADNESRFRYVRDFELNPFRLNSNTLGDLIQSMTRMTGLQRLYMTDGEALLEQFPALADIVGTSTSLRHFDIMYVGHLTSALLESMQANLVSIRLDWMGYDQGFLETEVDDLVPYHPVPFLEKWTSTLEELYCEAWYTPAEVPEFTQVYPKLHTLNIRRDDFPLVLPYIRAFPNLKRLTFRSDNSEIYDDRGELSLPRSIRRHRESNIASQLDPNGPGTWQHLEEFTGCLVDLYLLGLTSQISRIRVVTGLYDDAHLDLLPVVLSYAQPLHVILQGDGVLLTHPTRSLATILTEPWAARLESLVVNITLGEQDGDADVPSLLDALVASLAQLPMRRLRLHLNANCLDPTPASPTTFDIVMAQTKGLPKPRRASPAPLTPAELLLKSFDVDAFVRALGQAIPSLEDAIVKVVGPRGGSDCRRAVIARSKIHVGEDMDGHPMDYD